MQALLESEQFQRRLAETITWCNARLDFQIKADKMRHWQSRWEPKVQSTIPQDMEFTFRSPELTPLPVFQYDEHYPVTWEEHYVQETVDSLCAKRGALLRECSLDGALPDGLEGGRLLLSIPTETLADGPSEGETDGYVDVSDVPPWDTWIAFHERFIISWVPPSIIPVIDDGIYVNTSGCLMWIDDFDQS